MVRGEGARSEGATRLTRDEGTRGECYLWVFVCCVKYVPKTAWLPYA